MTTNSGKGEKQSPRWRYVALAMLIFLLMWALLAILWQVPQFIPQLGAPVPTTPPPTATRILPTPTPSVRQPTFVETAVQADAQNHTIQFQMEAEVPPDRQVTEAVLWYSTQTGEQLQRTNGPLSENVSINYKLDASQEGLTVTLPPGEPLPDSLDYWWYVRDTAGESIRAGGTVDLTANWPFEVVTPTLEPSPVDFTWGVSETAHFELHYVPGSAAERDLAQLGTLGESALARIQEVLDVEYDEQMSIYLVPRVFWQGGAAYSDKVQLISYLDRNYTSVETWSYFTHEGTHALAQDLSHPNNDGGKPDGVLVEGLAVWASGGHYHLEPVDLRVAVTADSDEYIPLAELRAGPFYDFQHEISYLEAASFVQFLVDQYGLNALKDLYSQATSDAAHDEALVEEILGHTYAELEADWLRYLDTLSPTPELARAWDLEVRSFDLMRRYEVELDPDARTLPIAPPDWLSDTMEIFLHRTGQPVNLVLETALIAAQERLYNRDLDGAAALLDDVEAALDAKGELTRPSLQARRAILEVLAAQDRAILLADLSSYLGTLDPAYAGASEPGIILQPPFTSYEQEIVRLDVTDDSTEASGVVLIHAQVVDGQQSVDGQLFAVTFTRSGDQWLLTERKAYTPTLSLPLVHGD